MGATKQNIFVLVFSMCLICSCEVISSSENGDDDNNLKEQILFTSNRWASANPGELGRFEHLTINRMNPDGSGVTQITELRSENESHFEASVSPDGTKIAFSLMIPHQDSSNELYIYTAHYDGSNMSKVVGNGEEHIINPRWSPVDSRIAFGSNRDGNYDVYTIKADGTNRTKVTESDSSDAYPTWSPTGEHIAFTSNRQGTGNIYIKNLQTGKVTQITDHKSSDTFPRWSPEGSSIVFTSNRDGDNEAYIVDIDTKETSQVTENEVPDYPFTWSPDARQIGYIAYRSDDIEVFKINASGSGNPVNLSNNPATDWDPHWDSIKVRSN